MNKSALFFVFGVLLVVIFQEVDSLQCWFCSSELGGKCGNLTHFDPKYSVIMTCPENKKYCGTLQTDYGSGFRTSIERSCFRNKQCDVIAGDRDKVFCETCQEDHCNAGLPSEPLNCWHCTSRVGGRCGNITHFNVNRNSKITCGGDDRYCGTLQVGFEHEFWSNVTRGCFRDKLCDLPIRKSNIFCETCQHDSCNTGVVIDSDPLKCWKCTSRVGGRCGNFTHFDKMQHSMEYCSETDKYCGTLQLVSKNGAWDLIKRGCVSTDQCHFFRSDDEKLLCETCQEDFCNSGLVTTSYFFMTVLFPIFHFCSGRVSGMQ